MRHGIRTMLTLGALLALGGATWADGVRFLAPADGATVGRVVQVRMAVDGMQVAPAGTHAPRTGHFHLLIDDGPVPAGAVVPKDERHIHYGRGQTEAEVRLAPGTHRLTLQFADGAHRSYGPDWAHTITVQVR